MILPAIANYPAKLLVSCFFLFLFTLIFVTPTYALTPNDAYFSKSWHLQRIGAPQAWDTSTATGIKIGLVDSGVDSTHPDLTSKIVSIANYTSEQTGQDYYGHGTPVAGILAAATNNSIGVAGVGYNATILSAKVINNSGEYEGTNYSALGNAIRWTVDNGAKVVLVNVVLPNTDKFLESAIDYAKNKKVLVVAPVTNAKNNDGSIRLPRSVNCEDSNLDVYPACYSKSKTNVISVAGSNVLDTLHWESDYASWVDVTAPVVNIWTTQSGLQTNYSCIADPADSNYCQATLNSYAGPQVAGVAAMIYKLHSNWSGAQVKAQIKSTADHTGYEGLYWTSGRINACKAVGRTDCPAVVIPSLVAHWKMDENSWNGSLGEVKDASGNNSHGTSVNGAYISQGAINNGGTFDGVDDYLKIPFAPHFQLTGNFTMSAWIKRDATSDYGSIIAKTNGSSTWDFDMGICQTNTGNCAGYDDKVFFYSSSLSPAMVVSTATIGDTAAWHHVAVTRSGSTTKFYIDGQPVGSAVQSGTLSTNTFPIQIGTDGPGWNNASFFKGKIDDVRLQRVAFSDSQMGDLYNESAGQVPPPSDPVYGLVAYWKLNEASWSGTTSEVKDEVSALNDGVAFNGTNTGASQAEFGNAGYFDGVDDFIRTPYSPYLNITNDYTMAAWIKRNALSDFGSIIVKTNGTSYVWDFDMGICQANVGSCGSSNDTVFLHSTGMSPYTLVSMGTISDTTDWHHVAITRKGSAITFYIDGSASGSATQSGILRNDSYGIQIGSDGIWSPASHFNGQIDEARIYNRALSAQEVSALRDLVP